MPAAPGRCTGAVRQSATGRTEAMRRTSLLLLAGLSFGRALTAPVFAQPSTLAPASARDHLGELIAEAALRFELPAAWIRAVMKAESNGDPRAISPKGAMGLMQIMPRTWAGLRDRYRLGSDPYDPRDNIIAGAAHRRRFWSPLPIRSHGPRRHCSSRNRSGGRRPLPCRTKAPPMTRRRHRACAMCPPSCRSRPACSSPVP